MKEATFRYTAHYRSTPVNARKTFEVTGSKVSIANEVAIEFAKHEMIEDDSLTELMELHRLDSKGTWLIPDMMGTGIRSAVRVI